MHAQPEIFQTEFAKVFARNCERVEIVLFQVLPKLAAALFVFSPHKSSRQEDQRYDDRSDNVDGEFTLERLNHGGCLSTRAEYTISGA